MLLLYATIFVGLLTVTLLGLLGYFLWTAHQNQQELYRIARARLIADIERDERDDSFRIWAELDDELEI
jgi:hypothetical protein